MYYETAGHLHENNSSLQDKLISESANCTQNYTAIHVRIIWNKYYLHACAVGHMVSENGAAGEWVSVCSIPARSFKECECSGNSWFFVQGLSALSSIAAIIS